MSACNYGNSSAFKAELNGKVGWTLLRLWQQMHVYGFKSGHNYAYIFVLNS